MTTSERQAFSALRATIARLNGPQGPAASPLDRVRLMARHLDAIERDMRIGLSPAPLHLVAIAAHALILYTDPRDET